MTLNTGVLNPRIQYFSTSVSTILEKYCNSAAYCDVEQFITLHGHSVELVYDNYASNALSRPAGPGARPLVQKIAYYPSNLP